MRRLLLIIGACLALARGRLRQRRLDHLFLFRRRRHGRRSRPNPARRRRSRRWRCRAGRRRRNWSPRTSKKARGAEAKAGDTVTVQYVGVNYKTGKEFDASWVAQRTVHFHPRRRRSDPGLGPGHRRDEGRRPARADHPARTRLRLDRLAAGDPAERNAGLRRRPRSGQIAESARDHRPVPRAPLAERLTAQALAGEPLRSPEAVAERLLAVQGQDPRGARLAVRARTEGVTRRRRRPGADARSARC